MKINKYFYRTKEIFDGVAKYSTTWYRVVLRTSSGCSDDEKFLRCVLQAFVLATVVLDSVGGINTRHTRGVRVFEARGFQRSRCSSSSFGRFVGSGCLYIQRLISRNLFICTFRFALLSRADANYDKMYIHGCRVCFRISLCFVSFI